MPRLLHSLILIVLIQTGILAQSVTQTTQECPTLTVECPRDLLEDPFGPATFTAVVDGGDPNFKSTFEWSFSAGEIVAGQGTPTITVKGSMPGAAFTATVKLIGLPERCHNTASCTIIYESPPRGRKYDEYGNLAFRDEKARLMSFAIDLKGNPDSSGYVVAFGGRRAQRKARLNRARTYLIGETGIEGERIVLIDGGLRGNQRFELWIVPRGARAPYP